jgi:hypothetical protein
MDWSTVFIRLLKTADGFVRHKSNKFDTPVHFGLTKEISVYIPRRITPAESQQLKLRRSHTFAASFDNESGLPLVCNFNGRPDHLWDQSLNSFITSGHGGFRGVLEISIEGTADFKATGIPPSKLRWKGSAVLGEYIPALGRDPLLVPWIAIYHENDEVINNLIEVERQYGTPYALEHARDLKALSSESSVCLELKPEWELASERAVYHKNKWIKENNFWLHLSIKRTGRRDEKHLLVLEIQRKPFFCERVEC